MLGGDLLGEGQGLGGRDAEHRPAAAGQGIQRIRAPRRGQVGRLPLDFRGHGSRHARLPAEQQAEPVGPVLGLREQVGRDPGGIAPGGGEDHDLGGPGQGIEADLSAELPLGLHEPDAARPHHPVAARHGR